MSVKSSILKAAVFGLRAIYAPMKAGRQKNRIAILSRQSDTPTLDIRLIADWIRENHPETECVVLCRKLEDKSLLDYGLHMLKQMRTMATSRVVLLDGYCIAASVLRHRQGTKVVQMWHALAAIKKFGYQTIDKPSGHSRAVADALCMHRNYDHVIAPSQATGEHFCSCFNVDSSRLVYLALPRVDEILRPDAILPEDFRGLDPASFRGFLRSTYEIPEDKELLLYVPTFRKGEEVDLSGLFKAVDPNRFALVVKVHPIYEDLRMEEIPDGLQVIVDKKHTSYQWLCACDRIITDYSALGVEAALLDKPLYYYVYDIDAYTQNVGLNVDPREEMPEQTAVTPEELQEALARPYDLEGLRAFRKKYVSVDTNRCAAALGEFLVDLIKDEAAQEQTI